jgi:DNA polymerase-3 subunit beta
MRFTVSQSALAKALTVVLKGITSNSTLPMLAGIYVKAEDGVLEFNTTDLNIYIRHRIPAMVEESGATVISGKMLNNIVKTLSDAPVTFDGGLNSIQISCERSRFNLNTLPAQDFPEFPQFAIENSVELPVDTLSDMVDRVYRVTSKDTSRPILGGILITVEENQVRLVATDSYRLAVCDTHVETSTLEGDFRMIIPGAAFHAVLSLPSEESTILLGATENQVVFITGNTTYISRRIEGNFPNYKQLLPDSCDTSLVIGLDDFNDALKRVSVVAQANSAVRFDIDTEADLLTMSATSQDQGDAREQLGVDASGRDVEIALNYRYVFDCINALSDEKEVTLELRDASQPAIFKSYAQINYLYLLMPVRL